MEFSGQLKVTNLTGTTALWSKAYCSSDEAIDKVRVTT